jgi:hypothetical protein
VHLIDRGKPAIERSHDDTQEQSQQECAKRHHASGGRGDESFDLGISRGSVFQKIPLKVLYNNTFITFIDEVSVLPDE